MNWLRDFLAAMGISPRVTVSESLPSFCKVTDQERKEDNARAYMDEQPQRLKRICDSVVKDPSLLGIGPITHCNLAVYRICRQFASYNGFYDTKRSDVIMANEMYDLMADSKDWSACTGNWAAEYAAGGGIAVAAQKEDGHGHVAIVYPGPMIKSPSWGKDVPMLANVGKTNGIMACSRAFRTEPSYFVLKTA